MNPPTGLDDRARKARFEEVVLPQVDVMYRVALSLTRNHADAEDVVQEALLRAYRAIDRFDGRYPRAWLLTIVRNAHLNRLRRRRPELLRDPDATISRIADPGDGGRAAEELVIDASFDAHVERAYNDLPDKFRRVVDLVDLEGHSYQEAADILGVPTGTIMSRLHRARRRMRAALADAGTGVDLSPTTSDEEDAE